MSSIRRPPDYPAVPPSPQPVWQRAPSSSNIRETLESILVAFILAFIFRAFVVEAFVIPTGSMAPTLMGAHMHFKCPDCGYEFDVNYSSPAANPDDMSFPPYAPLRSDVYCPNCGYRVARATQMENIRKTDVYGQTVYDRQGNPQAIEVPRPDETLQQVNFGDRILVQKYAYLLNEPHRWDVVVFKSPERPDEYHFSENFIKRLVGKPGETLMVLDGDLYLKNGDQWQILQRPPEVQQALWRGIYDNDYHPQGLSRVDQDRDWIQPWQAEDNGSAWDLNSIAGGRTFHFAGDSAATIRFNAHANENAATPSDYLIYDSLERMVGGQLVRGHATVADLKLSAWYERKSGAGPLQLRLSKRGTLFTATLSDHDATLDETTPDGHITRLDGPVNFSDLGLSASRLKVDLINVDYRVSLRLNDREVLHTTPTQYAPDVSELQKEFNTEEILSPYSQEPRIEIAAQGQDCDLSHISISRDIYYTNKGSGLVWGMPPSPSGDRGPVVLHHQGDPREDGKGTYDDDEYFVLGDNSLISGDARYWTDPINIPNQDLDMQGGRVPGRFILGRAFFVYWPAGFRPATAWPPLIPNTGDMRFIH